MQEAEFMVWHFLFVTSCQSLKSFRFRRILDFFFFLDKMLDLYSNKRHLSVNWKAENSIQEPWTSDVRFMKEINPSKSGRCAGLENQNKDSSCKERSVIKIPEEFTSTGLQKPTSTESVPTAYRDCILFPRVSFRASCLQFIVTSTTVSSVLSKVLHGCTIQRSSSAALSDRAATPKLPKSKWLSCMWDMHS